MAIHGTIEEAGLSDVLQLLAVGGKSGCLSVADGEDQGEIFLEGGRIVFAEVAKRRARFGDLLVKSGRISQEQLDRARALQDEGRPSLPEILVEQGILEPKLMERLVRIQVEEAVYFLFSWKRGEFTFTPNRRTPQQAFVMSLDAEGLLLEGSRRVDELDLIRRKIPSLDVIYRRSGSSLGIAAASLSEDQQGILPLLDGTRDVATIIETSGLGEFNVVKALYGLVTAGFAQLLERRSRVRHLDYREMLAYVVREDAFADAERRKDAARHIADCPSCGRRLRSVHVRHSAGTGTHNRRQGQDRRQGAERRVQAERRVAVSDAWLAAHPDRRSGESRRTAERRNGARPRRSEDGSRPPQRVSLGAMTAPPMPVMEAPAPPPPSPPPPPPERAPRQTEARRMPEHRSVRRSAPLPPPKEPEKKGEDLPWLMTPEESMEMVREHRRSKMVAQPSAPSAPPPPPPPPVAAAPVVQVVGTVPPPVLVRQSGRHRRPATQPRETDAARRRRHRMRVLGIGAVIAFIGAGGGYGLMELGSRLSSAEAEPLRRPSEAEDRRSPPPRVAPVVASPVAAPAAARVESTVTPKPAPVASAPVAPTPVAVTSKPAVRDSTPATAPVPAAVVAPLTPDDELAAGGWTTVDRAEARSILGGVVAAIPGLRIESIATSSVGGRPRVRVAQIARTGERIVLTQMSSGSEVNARARVTEVSASQLSPTSTIGTANLGGVFVTAKSSLAADALRPLLARLAPAR